MTNRELFLAFARFERVSRIPRRASFTSDLYARLQQELGGKPEEVFVMDSGRGGSLKPPAGYKPPDFSVFFPDYIGKPGFHIDGNGCGHLNHGYYHFTEYISPLRNAESFKELEDYPIPDNKTWSDTHLAQAGQAAHAAGYHASVFVGHMYESAWQIRGYEPFLMDLLTQPEWAELLLDRIAVNNRRVAEAAARAGYDCIMTGDDVANQNDLMFSPELWRRVMKPRWAAIIGAAKAIKPDIHVWYHSDGNIWDILDDLVEIGIDILNPVQPECMDPLAIRARFGKRLAFDGCLGTQTTFPFGTPEDVRKEVRRLAFDLDGMNGGLMLSPTHVLEPEVPIANIRSFFDTCGEIE
jgi:uroporphyrinogen decarboxylase